MSDHRPSTPSTPSTAVPGAPRGRRRRLRTAAVSAALAAITLPLLQATPAQAGPEPLSNRAENHGSTTGWNVLPSTARASAQCALGVTARRSNDASLSQQILQGRVPIEKYGTVVIPADPTWKPQAGLDSSGDAHMHSLHYLMPLLREGVRIGDALMVERFYSLLHDWSIDNQLNMDKPPNRAAWNPIYAGYRMQVIGCALAGPHGRVDWLRKLAAVHANYVTTYTSGLASNNTGIQLAMGQLAIGSAMGNRGWMDAARARLSRLSTRLVFEDGSTNEGAVSYAKSDYEWFRLAAQRVRLAGQAVPSSLSRIDRVPTFVAHSIRPDGRYEAIGDTSPVAAKSPTWDGTLAQWPASAGHTGTHPTATFAHFWGGGFIFGRSGWGTAKRPFSDQTFYSLRAGKGTGGGVFHAHADAGSLTLHARGAQQLYDVGQWKYQYGATRTWVMGRTAHNAVSASGGGYSTAYPPRITATSHQSTRDLVTMVDTGYRKNKIALTRSVLYSRSGEYLVVWDTARSTLKETLTAKQKKDKKIAQLVQRTYTQNWQLGPTRAVSVDRNRVSTSGSGANTTLVWLGSTPKLSVVKGRASPRRGWVSTSYGDLSAAPSVQAALHGVEGSWVTVVLPRRQGVADVVVDATGTVSRALVELDVTDDQGRVEHVRLTRGGATITR